MTWDVTVTLAFTDSTAISGGIDYTEPTPAEIVIPAGDVSASISVTTVDDVDVEGDETFDVAIASVDGAIDVSSPQTVTIIDNDEPIVDLSASLSVLEGDTAAITATLDVSVTWEVTVTLIFSDNTATGGIDYTEPTPAEIIIPAGDMSASISVTTVDDVDVEGDETFDVSIDNAEGAIDVSAPQTVTIIDNDEPNVDLSASLDVLEGESGSITATLDVSVTWDVTVTLAFTDDTATGGGTDYTESTPAEIVIPAGDVSASITFPTVDDALVEGDETFSLFVATVEGATDVSTLQTVAIIDNDEPNVDLAASANVLEGESGAITATLDVSVTWDVSVTLDVTNVTATGGGIDYSDPNPATIIIPAGFLNASSVFDAVDDTDIEGDESFDVAIDSALGAIDISVPQMVTIIDNDEPNVDLSASPSVLEGESGSITATLDVSVTWDISVTLTFTDDTALGSSDYVNPVPTEILIPAGELNASALFDAVDDDDIEGDETFIVAIESAVGATPVISPLVVTILDNDEPTVDLAATPALFEGESGAITATLDVSVTWDVSVTLAVTDVTATGGGVDFTDPNPATISIPAGALSASSVFDAIDDPDIEGDESFDVMIESTGGAIDTSSPLMVLILDNDEPAVDLAVTPVLVEGEIGAITATLDVSVTWDVSITLTFTEITASDGADYISPSPAEIFIPAGDLSANIPLGTVDDSLVEIDESLEVGVGEAYGAINVSSSSTVILLDNDEPTVDLAASLDVLEGDTGFITATLDITAPWDITVTLTLTDDTATGGGIDYSDPNPATIIIPAGSLSASSVFDAIDDSDVEGDESFDIAIASADGAIDVSSPQGITIVDNDEPYVDLSVTTDVVEGDSGTITATLDVSVTWDVTVTLAFTDDTATGGGTDYTEPIPAEIVIPSGDVSGSLSFSTIDDTDVEGDETFDIAIASAFGANDISTLQTVTILNDDEPNVVLAVTPSLLEGGTGFITATLDVASNQDVTVTLTFTDATAANGVDYSTATPAQIVIPAGFISAWASFNAFDDSQVEGDESFEVAIGSALGAIDISIPQTVTIIDNDEPTVALSTNSPVNEGTDATLTVTLNTASFQTITVSLLFSNGTATGSGIDYTEPAPAEIVIPAGDVSASITLPTVDDTDVEGNETFDASIASADGAIDVSTSQTVTIVDNDEPTVTLSTNSPVDEGMDVTLTAALDTASFQTVTVSLLFSNGTATGSGIDYTQPAIPEIIIPAGDLTGTAIVPTNDDGLVEDDETFDVSIASVSNAVDGSTPQTVTIVNNDQPTVVLGVSSPITEGNSATVTATLDILSNQNVTITLVFNDGSATGSSVDYSEPTVLDIVVPVGSLSGSTTVSTTNDLLAEGRETFEVGIASVVNAANGSSTQTIQIVDNDVAGVSLIDVNDGDTLLVDGDITVDEATSSIADRFGVFLDAQPATSNVVVAMSTDGQCEVSPSTLTFTTNNFDTQQTVDVTAVDDVIDEIKTHTCEIRLRYSGEPAYAALPEDILTAVVSDNDLLGVRLTDPNNGDVALATGAVAIDEANATPDQFSLSLAAKPASGDVIVTVSSDAQCTATPSSLTFSTITFDVPQTVSTVAVDDALDESSTHICTVTLNYATSIDSAYAVLIDSTVSVLVTDNDSSEILLTDPNDGNITLASDSLMVVEAGSTSDRFGLSLQAQPVSGNAIVDVTTDGQCHATPTSLTFAANNFDVTQIVTVTAIDDAIDEANPHGCSVTLSYGNSSDTTYASLAETVLNVAVSDNDSSGVSLLDPNNGDAALTDGAVAVDEATSTIADQFSVVLDSAPLAGNVQVALSSDSQCIVTPTALEFSAAMASTPQAVSVTAIDDMDSEATPHTCLITLDYSGSIDTIYAGLSSGSVRVAINDDDDIGISLLDPNNSNAPLGNVALVVDEATTAADQFAIVLMSAPTAGNASVAIATNGQCSVTPSALTFTAANATTAQVVDVVAIDDSDVEPNPHDCVLNLNYSSSTDATYAAFTNDIVNVLVSDDDETQVSNSLANPSSLLFIAQAGAANPPSQQVAFQYPGGSVGWSFSSWVSTSTSWGANSTLLMDVSVDVQGRREGTYQGTLVVTLGSEQVTVPIELRVVSQTELLVNRSELVFGGTQGEPAPSVQTVNVHSNDLSLLTWTASADQSWISLSSTSGTTPADLFVGIADAKMNDVGTHNAVITISDGTTTHSIAVQLNVIAAGANSIELTGLEVTQGVQNLLNAMPVVENRATFVRAHVRSRTGDAFSGVTAKLSGTRGGATVGELTPANGGGTINVIASPDRGQLNDSFLFELPPSWRTGDVVLTFSGVSHPIDCAESAGTPNDCQAAVTFEAVPDFPIHFINGSDTVSGYQFTTRAEDQLGTIKSIEAFLPVDVVNWAVSPTTLHYSGIRNNSEVLNDVRAIWTNDGSPQTHYYGLFAKYSASGAPQVNSISGIASLGGFMGMGDYTTWGESLNVHELGHNLGIGHAPCGTTSGLDPNFPYADARTSQVLTGDSAYYGFHIYNQTIYPPTTKDVMSYCSQKWIADWTYREALNVIKTKYVTTEAASSDLLAQAGERVIIIQGMVDPDSPSGTIDSVIHTMAQSDIVQPDIGANTLRLEDSQGNLLAGYQLPSQEQLDHSFNTISDTEQGYNLIVPYPEELSRLVLLHHGQVLDTREASANSPTIRLISPVDGSTLDGDTVVFEWQAEDTDGDELTYNVEYSNDNGQSWHELAMHWKENQLTVDTDSLPGGEQSMVRVVANDGVHGAFAQTQSSFSVPNHAPNALILAPATNRLYVGAQQIILEGTAHDQEDGRLTGEALVWRSDRNGVLGTGETLVLMADDLAEGQHTITLEATDSGGLISTRSTVPTSSIPNENDQEEDVEAIAIVNAIHIEVSRDRFTLPTTLAVAPAGLDFVATIGGETTQSTTISIRNSGEGTMQWSISDSANRLRTTKLIGEDQVDLEVMVDIPQEVGIHTGILRIESPDAVNGFVEVPYSIFVSQPFFENSLFLPLAR
ncbi:MAG: Calx-beta domain-containing protein [Chloroflexota bacterium]